MSRAGLPRLTGFRLALAITLGLALFYGLFSEDLKLLNAFELKTLDLKFSLRGATTPSDDVVVVAIDDYSIERLGRWPWPRSFHAKLVDLLNDDGASAIAFDLIFTEPEDSTELFTLRQLRQYYGSLSISRETPEGRKFGSLLSEAVDVTSNDTLLAEAIARGGNVGIAIVFQGFGDFQVRDESATRQATEAVKAEEKPAAAAGGDEPPPGLIDTPPDDLLPGGDGPGGFAVPERIKAAAMANPPGKAAARRFSKAQDILIPLYELYLNAGFMGHVNTFPDIDGNLRWERMVLEFAGQYYPSMSLKALTRHLGVPDEAIRYEPGQGLRVGTRMVPVDVRGRLLINYYGADRTFPYYSFTDVIEGVLQPGTFKDKIVLVGYSATGLGDIWTTPFSRAMPGVEKHATLISNMLQGDYLRRDRTTFVLDMAFIAVLGLVLGFFLPRLSPLRAALFAFTVLLAALGISFALFVFMDMWVNTIYPVLNVFLVSTGVIVYKFFTEEKEKRLVKKAFKQYLSPALVEELVKNPESLRLGGEEKELTVMFSDIRGFTAISEALTPEQLVTLLNKYLSAMTGVIMGNKGLVDKFIGDAIMAIFGAPLMYDEHPQMACVAAVEMFGELRRKMSAWVKDGYPEINIGVGLNTGPMIAGNMGSEDRFDYTVMGDSVNLASRLEALSKTYGAGIVISESTAGKIKGFALRELDLVRVKGRGEPVRIFELMGMAGDVKDERAAELEAYDKALGLYRAMRFSEAEGAFNALGQKTPGALYGLYAQRCAGFKDTPPPDDWDGVFTFTKKR